MLSFNLTYLSGLENSSSFPCYIYSQIIMLGVILRVQLTHWTVSTHTTTLNYQNVHHLQWFECLKAIFSIYLSACKLEVNQRSQKSPLRKQCSWHGPKLHSIKMSSFTHMNNRLSMLLPLGVWFGPTRLSEFLQVWSLVALCMPARQGNHREKEKNEQKGNIPQYKAFQETQNNVNNNYIIIIITKGEKR